MPKIFFTFLVSLCILSTGYCQNIPTNQLQASSIPATSVQPLPAAYDNAAALNYVRCWEVKMPVVDVLKVVESNNIQNVIQTTDYSDGMGRTLQNVKKAVTPAGKDMVSPRVYDNAGREALKYLSYPASTADGKIKLNAFAEQAAYFQSQPQYANEQVFYSKTVFDNSPISNVEKVTPVGNSWSGIDRGESMQYESNGSNEVIIWSIEADENAVPVHAGFYEAASLYRGVTVDPHGKRVVSYKDKEGRLLLKKIEIKNDGAAIINDYNGWLSTYFVFDDVNNPRYTITPKAVEWVVANAATALPTDLLTELCFRYTYDDKGRLIASKSPGAEEVCTVYDAKDRAILFRDGNLLAKSQWQYTVYDDQDRVVEKGLWANTQNRHTHQLLVENNIDYLLSVANKEVLQQFYYDDYSFLSSCNCSLPTVFNTAQFNGGWLNTTASTQFPYPLPFIQSQQTLNATTGTKTKILNSNPAAYLYGVVFYDYYGNAIQSITTNITGGTAITTTQYGYGGKVLASHVQHVYNGAGAQKVQHIYARQEYDDAGRLLKTYKKINNDPEKIVSSNIYNEQSQLVQVQLGHSSVTNATIETLDFTYTLTGAVKGTNTAFVNGITNDRFFGETIHTDFGFSNVQYNGNIAGVQWRSVGDGQRRAFGFSYDPANRLLKADFTQYTDGWNNNANVDFSMKLGDGVTPTAAYDANGNILSLSQKALQLSHSEWVDNLSYSYENGNYSNKLSAIADFAVAGTIADKTENILGDFKDNIAGSPAYDYLYDANGNVIVDNNKGITSIVYNHLNNPVHIQIAGKGSISYVYDATGERLQKIIEPFTGNSITYSYIDGFTYKNDQLQYFYTETGRVRPVVSKTGAEEWVNDFFIKDHLGNLRMIVTDEVRLDTYDKATLEDASISNEAVYYEKLQVGVVDRPGAFGTQQTNGQKVQLLHKAGHSIGAGKLMKVMVKDKINVSVDYYFPSETANNSNADAVGSLVNVLSIFFNAAGAPVALAGKGSEIAQGLNSFGPLNTLLAPQNAAEPTSLPKAYLNILFFDEQFRFVAKNSSIVPVTVSGSLQTILQANVEVPQNGYVYAYVSNESNDFVYFDNFQLSHFRGPLLEENHYNVLGAKMLALCSSALPGIANSLGYQCKGLDNEFDLDWYDFEARNYDAQTGRFLQQDPADQFDSPYLAMGNTWINGTDPDGRFYMAPVIIGAAIGAFINGIQTDFRGGDFLDGAWKGAITGAVGGALGQFGGGLFASQVLWGAGEGAITGGLSAGLNNGNVGKGALTGAAWGAAFSTVTTGIESYKNFSDGYGFGTNDGRIKSMLANQQYDQAIGFIRKRFNMENLNWTTGYGGEKFDKSPMGSGNYAITQVNPFAEVPTAHTIFGTLAIKNSSSLKATVAHEYGHFKGIIKGIDGLWQPSNEGHAVWNYFDGAEGYLNEINMANRMHINMHQFTKLNPLPEGYMPYLTQGGSFRTFKPVNPVWYSNMVKYKYFKILPLRYVFKR